jgi:hypothetical protein
MVPLVGQLWEVIARRWKARRYKGENGETVLSPLVFFRQRGRGVLKTGTAVALAMRQAYNPQSRDSSRTEEHHAKLT